MHILSDKIKKPITTHLESSGIILRPEVIRISLCNPVLFLKKHPHTKITFSALMMNHLQTQAAALGTILQPFTPNEIQLI